MKMNFFILVAVAYLSACALSINHPAYDGTGVSEDVDQCRWCRSHIEPFWKRAIEDNQDTTVPTNDVINAAMDAAIASTTDHDEAELIVEFVEHLRWDQLRSRQLGGIVRVYREQPTLRYLLQSLLDHVGCSCADNLGVGKHEHDLHQLLLLHSSAVRRELREYGYPPGMEDPATIPHRDIHHSRHPKHEVDMTSGAQYEL